MTTIVGSVLHGTSTANSDIDRATVVTSPLRTILSPFRSLTHKDKHNDEVDHTFYELNHFVKLCVQGNPTVLEVLWSTKREHWSVAAEVLYFYRHRLLDRQRIWYAHRGYAQSQLKKSSTPSDQRRMGKAWAAYLRVLSQGRFLIEEGEIRYPLAEPWLSVCRTLKTGAYTSEQIDKEFGGLIRHAEVMFDQIKPTTTQQPDISWIETYLCNVYGYQTITHRRNAPHENY